MRYQWNRGRKRRHSQRNAVWRRRERSDGVEGRQPWRPGAETHTTRGARRVPKGNAQPRVRQAIRYQWNCDQKRELPHTTVLLC
jgi:hypothetical protein